MCDVWEHAYYIDQKNLRAKYIENFWEIVNWEHTSKIFEAKEHLIPSPTVPLCNDPDNPICEYLDDMVHNEIVSS